MKPIDLDIPTIDALKKMLRDVIANAEFLQWQASQTQLLCDVANILAPFGFEVSIRNSWTFDKREVRTSCWLAYYDPSKPYYAPPVSNIAYYFNSCCVPQMKLVFMNHLYDLLNKVAAYIKKQNQKHLSS